MKRQVNQHYQLPASKALVDNIRGLFDESSDYQRIFDELRKTTADTATHAANLNMTDRELNDKSSIVGKLCIRQLVLLAENGLKNE